MGKSCSCCCCWCCCSLKSLYASPMQLTGYTNTILSHSNGAAPLPHYITSTARPHQPSPPIRQAPDQNRRPRHLRRLRLRSSPHAQRSNPPRFNPSSLLRWLWWWDQARRSCPTLFVRDQALRIRNPQADHCNKLWPRPTSYLLSAHHAPCLGGRAGA